MVNIKSLQVACGQVQATFLQELDSFISGVGEVNDVTVLWLTNPLQFAFNTATHGFEAALQCGTILCDLSGFKLMIDGENESRMLSVLPQMDFSVLLRKSNQESPT